MVPKARGVFSRSHEEAIGLHAGNYRTFLLNTYTYMCIYIYMLPILHTYHFTVVYARGHGFPRIPPLIVIPYLILYKNPHEKPIKPIKDKNNMRNQ